MTPATPVRSWRAVESGGLDLLHGTFTTHAFARHAHETYSIGLLEHGAMTFACRGGEYTLRPGLIGLINPDEAHDGHAEDGQGWTYRNLYPSAALLEGIFADLSTHPGALPRLSNVIDDALLAHELAVAHQAFAVHTSILMRESLLREALTKLLLRHAGHSVNAPRIGREARGLESARSLLEDDYARNVTLEELAHCAGLNPFTLLRGFQRTYGLPPHAYQLQVRLRLVKRLLQRGETLAQTALTAGFADQSHLGRHFKRAFGVTPQQYRIGIPNLEASNAGESKTF